MSMSKATFQFPDTFQLWRCWSWTVWTNCLCWFKQWWGWSVLFFQVWGECSGIFCISAENNSFLLKIYIVVHCTFLIFNLIPWIPTAPLIFFCEMFFLLIEPPHSQIDICETFTYAYTDSTTFKSLLALCLPISVKSLPLISSGKKEGGAYETLPRCSHSTPGLPLNLVKVL